MTESTTAREPVAYTVVEKSLVGNKIYEAGETAMYDGLPAENLAPQCDVGAARYQEYLTTNAARIEKMREFHSDSPTGDAAFGKKFMEMLAEQNREHAESMAALQAGQAALIAQAVASAMANAFPNGVGKAAAKAWTPKGDDKASTESIA